MESVYPRYTWSSVKGWTASQKESVRSKPERKLDLKIKSYLKITSERVILAEANCESTTIRYTTCLGFNNWFLGYCWIKSSIKRNP